MMKKYACFFIICAVFITTQVSVSVPARGQTNYQGTDIWGHPVSSNFVDITKFPRMPLRTPVDDGVLGDWAGLKPYLRQYGIETKITFTAELAANIQGGYRSRAPTAKQFAFITDFDLQKLMNWRNARIHIAISKRSGMQLEKDVGVTTLQQVQELYGRGSVWRMAEGWFEEDFGKFTIRVGRLSIGNEFDTTGCIFMNLGFCGPQTGNNMGDYIYTWPVSQWGTRFVYHITNKLYIQTGLYALDSKNPLAKSMYFGNPFQARAALVPYEVKWTPSFGRNRDYTGTYELGGWYSNDRAPHLDYKSIIDRYSVLQSNRYGGYANLEQIIYRNNSGKSLTYIVRGLMADGATSTVSRTLSTALLWQGISRGRPYDMIGVAFGVEWLSGPFKRYAMRNNQYRSHEFESEIFYSFSLSSWGFLRPNFQFIGNPGGYYKAREFIVGGLKAGLTF